MELQFPINLIGHDEWLESGYALDLSRGDVITRDGEFLGTWRVVDYSPDGHEESGRYEFIADGQQEVTLTRKFACLDYRTSRGLALSLLTADIREWHEASS